MLLLGGGDRRPSAARGRGVRLGPGTRKAGGGSVIMSNSSRSAVDIAAETLPAAHTAVLPVPTTVVLPAPTTVAPPGLLAARPAVPLPLSARQAAVGLKAPTPLPSNEESEATEPTTEPTALTGGVGESEGSGGGSGAFSSSSSPPGPTSQGSGGGGSGGGESSGIGAGEAGRWLWFWWFWWVCRS